MERMTADTASAVSRALEARCEDARTEGPTAEDGALEGDAASSTTAGEPSLVYAVLAGDANCGGGCPAAELCGATGGVAGFAASVEGGSTERGLRLLL